MRFTWLLLLGIGLLAGCQPSAKTANSNTATDKVELASEDSAVAYKTLADEYEQKTSSFYKEYRSAGSEEERQKLYSTKPEPSEYAQKFLGIADEAADSPAAVNSLVWVITNAGQSESSGEEQVDFVAKAKEQLISRFKDSELMGNALPFLTWDPKAETQSLLEDLAANSPHKSVQGIAKMAMFKFAQNLEQIQKVVAENPERLGLKEDQVEYIKNATVMDAEDQIALMTDLSENYSDITYCEFEPGSPGTLISTIAAQQLFVLQNLRIGKVAPDIDGVDLNDVRFKLSEYRGKVILLDFWGDW